MKTLAEQVAEAKKQAEQEIFAVIERLHRETGLCVDAVQVSWLQGGSLYQKDRMQLVAADIELKG